MPAIPVPVAKKYIATMTDSTWKSVICKHCRCEFAYQLTRSATKQVSGALWSNGKEMAKRARLQASMSVAKQLSSDVGAYRCPSCGKYQKNMVDWKKRKKWGNTAKWIVGMIVGWLIFFILIVSSFGNKVAVQLGQFMLVIEGVITTMLVIWALVYDPERDDPPLRKKQVFSEKYPVLRREEYEQISRQMKMREGIDIPALFWIPDEYR